jgi:transposase
VRRDPTRLECSNCRSREVVQRGEKARSFKTVPIGAKGVVLVLPIERLGCKACGAVRQTEVLFADERRTYTHAFERYALDLLRRMTIQDVAHHLGVGWDLIKEIQKRNLKRRFAKPKLKKLHTIAIDEICIGHGHRYLMIVLDLISGAVVFIGDGKGADALGPFWRRLKAARARVRAVAMDMSQAYNGLAIHESAQRTGHVIVADYDWEFCGFGAEVAARVQEQCWGRLRSPVTRIGFAPVPCPTVRALENVFYPNAVTIIRTIEKKLGLKETDLSGESFYTWENRFKGPF